MFHLLEIAIGVATCLIIVVLVSFISVLCIKRIDNKLGDNFIQQNQSDNGVPIDTKYLKITNSKEDDKL